MNTMHGSFSPLRMISRCALTGVLVGLMTTQSFAQGGAFGKYQATSDDTNATVATQAATPAAAPTAAPTTTQTPAPNLMASLDSNLPDAPAVATPEAAPAPSPRDSVNQNALTSTPTKGSHVKGGWLALGIAGTVIAGFGAYVAARGANARWDAIFLAPGLGMAGAGYYFAFKK